jgi:hypothetical protein
MEEIRGVWEKVNMDFFTICLLDIIFVING